MNMQYDCFVLKPDKLIIVLFRKDSFKIWLQTKRSSMETAVRRSLEDQGSPSSNVAPVSKNIFGLIAKNWHKANGKIT